MEADDKRRLGLAVEAPEVPSAPRRAIRFARALAVGGLAVAMMTGCGDDETTKKPDADTNTAVDGPLAPPNLPRSA